jgi:peroxiredoxin
MRFFPICLFIQVHFMFRSAGRKSYSDTDYCTLVRLLDPGVTFCLLRSNSYSANLLRFSGIPPQLPVGLIYFQLHLKEIVMVFETPDKSERHYFIGATAFRMLLVAALCFAVARCPVASAEPPNVGQKAPDFELRTPSGELIQLSKQIGNSTVVLVVLRGFPGYQCPYCQKQVHDFIEHSADFVAKNTSVILVYPGPPANLDQHATEFLTQQLSLPANVLLVIDPDYVLTNRYDLRWDGPGETAYPSTFILDRKGSIIFEKISHGHGDRTKASDILARISQQ